MEYLHDDEHSFSPGLFVTQLILAPLGGLLVGLITAAFLEELLNIRYSNTLTYLAYGGQGFLFGYLTQKFSLASIKSGGAWIWIAPASLLIWSIIYELGRPNPEIAGLFLARRANPGGAMFLALVTMPTLASVFYSIGVVAASRSWRARTLMRHVALAFRRDRPVSIIESERDRG